MKISKNDYLNRLIEKPCICCGKIMLIKRSRKTCSERCRLKAMRLGNMRTRGEMNEMEADVFLASVVSHEDDPPWIRHPVPWDCVVPTSQRQPYAAP